jgi:membrane protease YdiL (CAAX protease family)
MEVVILGLGIFADRECMRIILLVVFLAYFIATLISGIQTMRKFRGVRVNEPQRLGIYRKSMALSWAVSLCLSLVAFIAGFSPADIGIRLPDLYAFQDNFIISVIVIVAGAAALALFSVQCIRLATSEASRTAAWTQLADESADGRLKDFAAELMVPRSARERRMFPFVALTAGVCEEFIMRGVMFALVLYLVPDVSPFLIPVISGVVFGFAHIYQGVSGIVKTGAAGLFLGFIYIATGSLLPAMILHFVMDLSSGFIAPKGVRRTD